MPSNDTENIYSTQYGGEGGPIPATRIGYDNTTSHLTADDVQEAIDEVVGNIADLTGADIAYDNDTSGLTAANVQDAIDENAVDIGALKTANYLALTSDYGTITNNGSFKNGKHVHLNLKFTCTSDVSSWGVIVDLADIKPSETIYLTAYDTTDYSYKPNFIVNTNGALTRAAAITTGDEFIFVGDYIV